MVATLPPIAGLYDDLVTLRDQLNGGKATGNSGLAIAGAVSALVDLVQLAPGIANGNIGDFVHGLGDVATITIAVESFTRDGQAATLLLSGADVAVTALGNLFK
ncbi:hypothetical protein [Mycolicibacterium phocaicum]|uniref:hypothetical protein n=1 Tax=Mycolicibacterium phocaicum TaxID=319706 RepID=UPI00138BB741|nr:hypothetical protein [Mycolicibacterium phocaicum]BBZ55148.1 hypothetical protein MPHO_21400 [Mycolicibacterium phocaicum]